MKQNINDDNYRLAHKVVIRNTDDYNKHKLNVNKLIK